MQICYVMKPIITFLVTCETGFLWITVPFSTYMYPMFDAILFCFAGDFQSEVKVFPRATEIQVRTMQMFNVVKKSCHAL